MSQHGELHLALSYDSTIERLSITLIEAKNLPIDTGGGDEQNGNVQ